MGIYFRRVCWFPWNLLICIVNEYFNCPLPFFCALSPTKLWLTDYQSQTVLDWMLLEIPIKAPSIMTYEVKKFLHLPMNRTKLLSFVQLRGERDNFTVSLSLLHFSLVNVFFVCKNCLFLFHVIYLAKGLLDLTPFQLILVQVEENRFVTFVKKG